MIISHRHKFIFIHIYKVAGTSVSHALRPYASWPCESAVTKLMQRVGYLPSAQQFSDHVSARELKAQLSSKMFETYYKFAFVRNPWDWQVSLYQYILKNPKHRQHENVIKMRGFEDYLRWQLARSQHKPWSSQKNFVTDTDGNLIVDYVGRYETLNDDFATVLDHLGLSARLPHLNKTKAVDYRDYYTPKTSQMLFDYYRADIEMFGYQPPVLMTSA